MNSFSNLYGGFSVKYDSAGEPWLIHIIPDMAPAKVGLKPLGSYFIYCIHTERGSCSFILEQDDEMAWYSDRLPPFLGSDLLAWLGKQIEEHK